MNMPASRPVLLETTSPFLVWVRADTPATARRAAEKDPGRFLGDLGAHDGAPVDGSTDAAVTQGTAEWLDLEPEVYQRLDDYFADLAADTCADDDAGEAA